MLLHINILSYRPTGKGVSLKKLGTVGSGTVLGEISECTTTFTGEHNLTVSKDTLSII